MTTVEIITIIGLVVAIIALIFNAIETRRSAELLRLNILQAKSTAESLLLDHQLARGNAIIHFTSRFFDLLKDCEGELQEEIIKDQNWAYQFWGLLATEFYFFHHGMLPAFMYALWMIELAKIYSSPNGEAIYKSHMRYLQSYSFNYQEMIAFFGKIYNLAKEHGDENLRNKEVGDYTEGWIKGHKKLFELS